MNFFKRFSYAFQGLKYLILKEKNVRLHLVFFLCALILAVIFSINYLEWIIVFLISALVISLEIINTAIEKLADFVEEKENPKIKIIKDISAAAVLVASIFALGLGIFIFAPKICTFFK